MLLSRVADALYWISRYLERADHTARVVDIAVDLGLGRQTRFTAIDRLYGSLSLDGVDAGSPTAAERAFFDPGMGSSVLACVVSARENARQVREEISTDMWEQLNALFLRLRRMSQDPARTGRTHYVARAVSEGVHLFQGITDATMGHSEGWQYLQAGRGLERAAAVASLLDTFLADTTADAMAPPLDQVEWVALLRSCYGLEGYCRQYTADVRRDRVTEFLLLDAAVGAVCGREPGVGAARAGAPQRPPRRRPCRAAGRPPARLARLRPGGRDPRRGPAPVPGRDQPAVRADPHGALSDLHRVPDRAGAAGVARGQHMIRASQPLDDTSRRRDALLNFSASVPRPVVDGWQRCRIEPPFPA
jgi:uncharacterized alpha-E superfamily protein